MIRIIKCSSGDTRTANKMPTYQEFQRANDLHRGDVRKVMNMIANDIHEAGLMHDFTKKQYEELFYEQFKDTLESGLDNFK